MSRTPQEYETYLADLRASGRPVQLRKVLRHDMPACKTIMLEYVAARKAPHQLITVLIEAPRMVCHRKVAAALGISEDKLHRLQIAKPGNIQARTGFVPGGIPPIGCDVDHRLIDTDVLSHAEIMAGGGNLPDTYTYLDPRLILELYPCCIVRNFKDPVRTANGWW